jgi:hypothetical protein
MRLYLLPLFPIWLFLIVLLGKWFLGFSSDHSEKWWGGAPLWMAGCAGILLPALLYGLFIIANLIWS